MVVRYTVVLEVAKATETPNETRTSNGSDSAPVGFIPVAKVNDISEGAMVGSMVSGIPILISRIGGSFYAMEAVCSHFFGYLPKGELRGNVVICPVHKAQYDARTGKVVKNVPGLMKLAGGGKLASDLRTFEIRVVGDSILVKA